MKALSLPLGVSSEKINVAVQRPTVNVKEAENLGEQLSAETAPRLKTPEPLTFSKHGTFHTNRMTHPGLEDEKEED